MAGTAITVAAINSQIAQDAAWMMEFYHQLKTRYQVWNENAGNATQLSAAGMTTAADQNQVIAVVGDMNRLIQVFEGTMVLAAGNGPNVIFDLAAVRGCN